MGSAASLLPGASSEGGHAGASELVVRHGRCPQDHALVLRRVRVSAHYYCDKCEKAIIRGNVTARCNLCDFDQCHACSLAVAEESGDTQAFSEALAALERAQAAESKITTDTAVAAVAFEQANKDIVEDLFKEYDSDNDGWMTVNDVAALLRQIFTDVSARTPSPKSKHGKHVRSGRAKTDKKKKKRTKTKHKSGKKESQVSSRSNDENSDDGHSMAKSLEEFERRHREATLRTLQSSEGIQRAAKAIMARFDRTQKGKMSLDNFLPFFVLALRDDSTQEAFMGRLREAVSSGELFMDGGGIGATTLEALSLGDKVANEEIPHHGSEKEDALEAAACIRLGRVLRTDLCDSDLKRLGINGEMRSQFGSAQGWLMGNLAFLAKTPGSPDAANIVKAAKHLLGSIPFSGGLFGRLKAVAKQRLTSIAETGETEIYERNGYSASLGTVGEAHWNRQPRLDDSEVLGGGLWTAVEGNIGTYMAALMLLAAAMDADFQAHCEGIATQARGRCHAAPVKRWERLESHLDEDHANNKRDPTAAHNVDMSRNTITFSSTEDLMRGFEAMASRFPPLSVSNGFCRDYDARAQSFGLRSITMNGLYVPDPNPDGSPTTWGQLFERPGTQAAWLELELNEFNSSEDEVICFHVALDCLAEVADEPARFVVETQFLMDEYLAMKKESRFWNRIFRALDGQALLTDFAGYCGNRVLEPVSDPGTGKWTGKFCIPALREAQSCEGEGPMQTTADEDRAATYVRILKADQQALEDSPEVHETLVLVADDK